MANGLKKRDMARPKLDKPRGVLHTEVEEPRIEHRRYWPTDDLAPFVEHYWTVAWDLDEPQVRETLPHPSVHMVFENGLAQIAGAWTKRFTRVLGGKGNAFAIKFRPGGFHTFVTEPICRFTDGIVAVEEIFGAKAAQLIRYPFASSDPAAAIEMIETFLRSCDPQPDPAASLAARIAERIASDHDITRIEQVAREFKLSTRALQRVFREYVGVSPKWVIQRYRLHELVERIETSAPIDWTALATDLGYADQAHLIRDFKKLVGTSPTGYIKAKQRTAK
jgi:AraC-like DNA-binding protein